jgi:hypothetical protein
MTRVEEDIWMSVFAKVFSREMKPNQHHQRRFEAAVWWAYYGVQAFRGVEVPLPLSDDARTAADDMWRGMQGKVESERLSIQKEMVRGLIQFIEGRIKHINNPHRHPDLAFERHRNEIALDELRSLVHQLDNMLHD